MASIGVVAVARIVAPESKNFGRGLMMAVMFLSAFLHLGSLIELVVVVKFLGRRPIPIAVLLLVGYWLLLAGVVVVSALAS